jgi:dihydropyrimidinase
LHHGSDYTPFEGIEIKGWPIQTWLRGQKIYDKNNFLKQNNVGQYISRGFSSL